MMFRFFSLNWGLSYLVLFFGLNFRVSTWFLGLMFLSRVDIAFDFIFFLCLIQFYVVFSRPNWIASY